MAGWVQGRQLVEMVISGVCLEPPTASLAESGLKPDPSQPFLVERVAADSASLCDLRPATCLSVPQPPRLEVGFPVAPNPGGCLRVERMNVEVPGDLGIVWVSELLARVPQPLSGGNAKGKAAAGLPQAAFPAPHSGHRNHPEHLLLAGGGRGGSGRGRTHSNFSDTFLKRLEPHK